MKKIHIIIAIIIGVFSIVAGIYWGILTINAHYVLKSIYDRDIAKINCALIESKLARNKDEITAYEKAYGKNAINGDMIAIRRFGELIDNREKLEMQEKGCR